MKVTYIAAPFDSSGYSEACRNYIGAMLQVGIDVDVKPLTFERFKTDTGELGRLIQTKINVNANNNVQIIHTVPDVFPKAIDKTKYNIGYTVWETDRLPDNWVPLINMLDEVWVPSTHNLEVFKRSGIKIPVIVIPHCISEAPKDVSTSELDNINNGDFLFYSIFQWTTRKNPEGLIKAFCSEFSSNEKVALVLKTYAMTPGSPQEKQKLIDMIKELKAYLYLKDAPRILLVSSLLTREQMWSLHKKCDCFISLHCCEGFGMPFIEAMQCEKPVISTNYGGPSDFLAPEYAYPINYKMTPVHGMPWSTYNARQNWAEPDLMEAKKAMREIFNNKEEAKRKAVVAKEVINKSYSWEAIGNKIKARLSLIMPGS